jgi:hypothetical protein
MSDFPCLVRSSSAGGEVRFELGDPLVDSYLAFLAGRARPNTLRAVAHDLKSFFSVIDKAPVEVAPHLEHGVDGIAGPVADPQAFDRRV